MRQLVYICSTKNEHVEYYLSHPAFIIAFVVIVLAMLILDLGVFNKKSHVVGNKEAITWSLVWIGLAMLFSVFIWKFISFEKFTQFQSAYWIEKALSVDNLFVFILVFKFFKVPTLYHHKVLFWGIIGALVMRAVFIFAGVELIQHTYLPDTDFNGFLDHPIRINVVMVVFGVFLIIAGIKSALKHEEEEEKQNFNQNIGARFIHKVFRTVPYYDQDKFFTIQNGKRVGTQLLVVVGVIEFTDLIFAVDSIPAIFAIAPDDPFILYTSNIFAILGLRSLYFILANFIHMFQYLKYGLGIILVFIGFKMFMHPFFHVPSPLSLTIVGGVLALSVVASLIHNRIVESRKKKN
jgi:tellurite resistance protein TerC